MNFFINFSIALSIIFGVSLAFANRLSDNALMTPTSVVGSENDMTPDLDSDVRRQPESIDRKQVSENQETKEEEEADGEGEGGGEERKPASGVYLLKLPSVYLPARSAAVNAISAPSRPRHPLPLAKRMHGCISGLPGGDCENSFLGGESLGQDFLRPGGRNPGRR